MPSIVHGTLVAGRARAAEPHTDTDAAEPHTDTAPRPFGAPPNRSRLPLPPPRIAVA
ncbi:hypothetical protein GCM10009548_28440 [Streptomyces malaysiensis subsp. malaysiensis]